jgi:hypothetical protein
MKPPSHIVLRRPFSDDPDRDEEPRWEKVGFAPSLAAAKRLALNPVDEDGSPFALSHGDLLCVMKLEYVTPQLFPEHAEHLFVVGRDGVRSAPRVPSVIALSGGKTWMLGWEGPKARADAMLKAASNLGVRSGRLVLAAADCAETTSGDALITADRGVADQLLAVVAAAKAWAAGKGTSQNVLMLTPSSTNGEGVYRWSSFHAAHAYVGRTVYNGQYAARAARMAASNLAIVRSGTTWGSRRYLEEEVALREMSAMVRKWIPLSVILLSKLAEPINVRLPSGGLP